MGGGAAEEKDSYKKRVAELENDIQLSRMERASFIEQINKQFKEEEKLLATVQTMKNEFEELRSTYTQTVSKLQDSRYTSPASRFRSSPPPPNSNSNFPFPFPPRYHASCWADRCLDGSLTP